MSLKTGNGVFPDAAAQLDGPDLSGIRQSHSLEQRELLLRPLAVLEEICRDVLVEGVPPLCGVGVEAVVVEGVDGTGPLE